MCVYVYVMGRGSQVVYDVRVCVCDGEGQPSSIYLVSDPGCPLLTTLLLNVPLLRNGTVIGLLPPGAVLRSKAMG